MVKISSKTVRQGLTGALLVLVVGAPAAASWQGLTAAGTAAIGLTSGWSVLVPLVLDAAGLLAAVLALRDVLHGDSATGNRALVAAYALGSAALNLWHADHTRGVAAALFFAAASVSSVVLWERLLRALRRDQLRAVGALSAPLPRFRPARWLVAPRETARAWRVAVVEGVTDPAVAVALARDEDVPRPPRVPVAAERRAELAGLSKADTVRQALRELAGDSERVVPAAEVVAWLAARGVEVAPGYVGDVIRRRARTAALPDASGAGDVEHQADEHDAGQADEEDTHGAGDDAGAPSLRLA